MTDALQEVKSRFFTGHLSQSFSLCESLKSTGIASDNEFEALKLCSFAGMQALPLEALLTEGFLGQAEGNSLEMDALRGYAAALLVKEPEQINEAINKLKELGKTPSLLARYIAAAALTKMGEYSTALEICEEGSLQLAALKAFTLIKMCQFEAVENDAIIFDDDEAIGKLCTSWLHLLRRNTTEAYLTLEDIKFFFSGDEAKTESQLLLNSKAIINMDRGMWDEALEDLQAAYNQNPNNTETIANFVCYYTNISKHDKAQEFYKLLEGLIPNHFVVKKVQELEKTFQEFTPN